MNAFMGTASLSFDSWTLAWRELCARLAPACGLNDCVHAHSLWQRLRSRRRCVLVHGACFCQDQCLERALDDILRRMRSAPKRAAAAHRIPLGLLLLSRQQVTPEQLRQALASQSANGGRIGECLQRLNLASEAQITAALARQWSCPVLHTRSFALENGRIPQLPVALLESFDMAPVDYVASTVTLHMAFCEGIDYGVLYAIEQMLGCHTEPCLMQPSVLRRNLAAWAERRSDAEVVFDRVADTAELARIVCSYTAGMSAAEIRLASCGPHLWVRLLRDGRRPLDLLLRSPRPADALPEPEGSGSV